jgi:hypothetical protein
MAAFEMLSVKLKHFGYALLPSKPPLNISLIVAYPLLTFAINSQQHRLFQTLFDTILHQFTTIIVYIDYLAIGRCHRRQGSPSRSSRFHCC